MISSLPFPSAPVQIEASRFRFSEAPCVHDGFVFHVLAWENQLLHLTFSLAAHDKAKCRLQKSYPAATFDSSRRLREEILEKFILVIENYSDVISYPVIPFFLEGGTPFQQKVWRLLSRIPYGEVRTYSEIARELGNPGYARAVGGACHANPLALIIPCHRVVAAQGRGGFNGGSAVKERLLRIERKGLAEGLGAETED